MGNMMADAYEALRHEQAAKAADREPYRTTTYTQRLDALERRVSALEPAGVTEPPPAPALTEDAIVAALKADPAMAGRAMVELGISYTPSNRDAFGISARHRLSAVTAPGAYATQSLAVALAAASYRG